MTILKDLYLSIPQVGSVDWIGLRPERRATILEVESAVITKEDGIVGDRFSGKPGAKRMVTLIQKEHLDVIAKVLGVDTVSPALLRRNIVVSGINLLSLRAPAHELEFQIGEVILKATGPCHPCSRMEETLGPGGYNAARGHGGITATVIKGGTVKLGDQVALIMPIKVEHNAEG